jgi:hypothetical protein
MAGGELEAQPRLLATQQQQQQQPTRRQKQQQQQGMESEAWGMFLDAEDDGLGGDSDTEDDGCLVTTLD